LKKSDKIFLYTTPIGSIKMVMKRFKPNFTHFLNKRDYYTSGGSFFLTSAKYLSKMKLKENIWNKNVPYIGEDAFFISTLYSTMGIADGIRGWEKRVDNSDFDCSDFSWRLMQNAQLLTQEDYKLHYPEEIIRIAYNGIIEKDQVLAGSSTVILFVKLNFRCVLFVYLETV
jgi:hypothetical protein